MWNTSLEEFMDFVNFSKQVTENWVSLSCVKWLHLNSCPASNFTLTLSKICQLLFFSILLFLVSFGIAGCLEPHVFFLTGVSIYLLKRSDLFLSSDCGQARVWQSWIEKVGFISPKFSYLNINSPISSIYWYSWGSQQD